MDEESRRRDVLSKALAKGYVEKTGIWSLEEAEKRHRFDPLLAESIYKVYNPQSVADIGCGIGAYCKYLKEMGCDIVHGYEGTRNIKKISVYDDIMFLDLTKKRVVDIYYDLVLCLEVGEHIPEEYEHTLIDNIVEFTSKSLLLSWAIPGQGGLGHFNEKDTDYIINEISKRGLKFIPEESDILRKSSSLRWFKNTLMSFYR